MGNLTPYDTGSVLEPQLWQNPDGLPAEAWGNVDFDNPEGETIATVRMTKTSLGYELHVYQHGDNVHEIITFKKTHDSSE